MEPRMTSPALSVPGVLDALQSLSKAVDEAAGKARLPQSTIELISFDEAR